MKHTGHKEQKQHRWNGARTMLEIDILGVGSLKLRWASFRGNLWFKEGENSKGILPVPWIRRSHAIAECKCISAAFENQALPAHFNSKSGISTSSPPHHHECHDDSLSSAPPEVRDEDLDGFVSTLSLGGPSTVQCVSDTIVKP